MQINISTRHGHISAATQEKLTAKLERLPRFLDRVTAVNLTLNLEHEETPDVELSVSVERAEDFVANDRSESLMGSVDAVIHKVEQQLRRHKEKLTNHRPGGRRIQRVPAEGDELSESE